MSDAVVVIDIGNTTIHAGLYCNGEILDPIRIGYKKKFQAINEFQHFSGWLNSHRNNGAVSNIAICSVVPSFTDYITSLYHDITVFTVHSGLPLGIELPYTPVESFGADRLANLVALRKWYGYPAVVIDVGSALTCDLLDAQGNFAGGMIFPGPGLCLKSLHEQTAQLPQVDLDEPHPEWGFSTESSIRSGVYKGFTCMIKSLIDDARSQLQADSIRSVATGGWSMLLQPFLPEVDHFDEYLTLKGIGEIFSLVKNRS
ncbi:MAG: type III pantothenate kinase [Candidatus Auribacterota bacterium]|nr:type III pantothenate kinase [Candidatus Auribacterota bacterium]